MWSVCQVEIRFADVTCCFFLYLIRSRGRYGLWIYVEFIVLSFLPSIPLSGFTDISVIIIIIVNDWSFCFLFISSFWFRNLLKRRKKNLLNLIITESMRRVKRCVCVCVCVTLFQTESRKMDRNRESRNVNYKIYELFLSWLSKIYQNFLFWIVFFTLLFGRDWLKLNGLSKNRKESMVNPLKIGIEEEFCFFPLERIPVKKTPMIEIDTE